MAESSSGGGAGGGGRDGEKIKAESIRYMVMHGRLCSDCNTFTRECRGQLSMEDSRCTDGTYRDITGATENKYTISEEDLGKFIKVTVTGTGKYKGTVSSDAVGPVVYDAEKTVISNELRKT